MHVKYRCFTCFE